MRAILVLVLSLALALAGCSGNGSNSGGSNSGSGDPGTGSLIVNLSDLPAGVTDLLFQGTDAEGNPTFGPVTRPAAGQVRLDGVPAATRALILRYLAGTLVVGLGTVPVEVTPGAAEPVDDPPVDPTTEPIAGLAIEPAAPRVPAGQNLSLTALAFMPGSRDPAEVTSLAGWTSSNRGAATVSRRGVATGHSAGDTEIRVRLSPESRIATGADGGPPHVKSFGPPFVAVQASFFAFDPAFTGGVRVATGDVDGDGRADLIEGAGPGGGPHVKVFSGSNGVLIRSFLAYPTGFSGGVYVASGDVNGDGRDEIITGAGAGAGPHVKVFDGQTLDTLASFFAFDAGFTGGVRVATGDVTGDGTEDVVAGTGPGGSRVRVLSGPDFEPVRDLIAFSDFPGGIFVGAGDVDGDGHADLVTGADAGGTPHVKVFSGASSGLLSSFFAFDEEFRGGVRVAAGDYDGDGVYDVIAGPGPGAVAEVKVFEGTGGEPLASFLAYPGTFQGGVFVAGTRTLPAVQAVTTLTVLP